MTLVMTSVWSPGARVLEEKNVTFSRKKPGSTTGAVYDPASTPSSAYSVVGMPCTSTEPRDPTTITCVPAMVPFLSGNICGRRRAAHDVPVKLKDAVRPEAAAPCFVPSSSDPFSNACHPGEYWMRGSASSTRTKSDEAIRIDRRKVWRWVQRACGEEGTMPA